MVIKSTDDAHEVHIDKKSGRIRTVIFHGLAFFPKKHFKPGTKFISTKFRKPGTKTVFVRPHVKHK